MELNRCEHERKWRTEDVDGTGEQPSMGCFFISRLRLLQPAIRLIHQVDPSCKGNRCNIQHLVSPRKHQVVGRKHQREYGAIVISSSSTMMKRASFERSTYRRSFNNENQSVRRNVSTHHPCDMWRCVTKIWTSMSRFRSQRGREESTNLTNTSQFTTRYKHVIIWTSLNFETLDNYAHTL